MHHCLAPKYVGRCFCSCHETATLLSTCSGADLDKAYPHGRQSFRARGCHKPRFGIGGASCHAHALRRSRHLTHCIATVHAIVFLLRCRTCTVVHETVRLAKRRWKSSLFRRADLQLSSFASSCPNLLWNFVTVMVFMMSTVTI